MENLGFTADSQYTCTRKSQNNELQYILSTVYYICGKLLRRNNNKNVKHVIWTSAITDL